MNFLFIVVLLLVASCAPPPPRPYPVSPGQYDNRSAPAPADNRPGGSVSQQDAADCERKAALSASAGGRAEAFDNCMKARTRTAN